MEDLLGGPAIGVAFDLLMKAVLDVALTVASFRSELNHLKSTLISIKPFIEDIEELNRLLNCRQGAETLNNLLTKGEMLVRKCLKINRWNLYQKYRYAKKLEEFESSLLWFFQINVQAELSRDGKSVSLGVKVLEEKMDEIISIKDNYRSVNSNGFSGRCGVPAVPDFVVGLDVQLQELKSMLLRDGVQIVVLSAPGGCGKTTLAKLLCNDDGIKGIYGNNIFFQTVSRSPNLQLIVQKVFQSNKSQRVPIFQSDEDAIHQLEQFFRWEIGPAPILLVLDDIWSRSESIIEQFLLPISGYKILVTSRFVFPQFEWTYKLNMLNHQDAMTLFHHFAFKDGICTVQKNLAEEVVRGCSGSPLALTVVGRSLYRQPEVKWVSTVQNWSQGQSIYDTNMVFLSRLKTSLDALDEMAILKNCFLDLGLFPEDQRIPAAALMDIWVELYNLDEGGMYTLIYLHELSNRNLVNLTLVRKDDQDAVDYCQDHFVMQHDLLRELAIHQSRQGSIERRERLIVEIYGNASSPEWLTDQKQQPMNAHILSISTDDAFCSNWSNVQLPDVKVLILNFQTKIYTLPAFMERMSRLTVLLVTNYGFTRAHLDNFPLPSQLVNLKRLRFENISIPSIATSILQLKNLQKISMVTCEIGKAFEVSTISISYTWPILNEINIEYCDDLVEMPAWFCSLIHLKKIDLRYCQELVTLPTELENLTNLEVLSLQSCTKLLELPESISGLRRLMYVDLSDCVEMDHLPEQLGDLCGLRTIRMVGCTALSELPPSVMYLVQLERVICDEETAYLWEVVKEDYLDRLEINVVKEDKNLNWLHKIPP
ncbi:probable disease resistance protein At5g66900 [Olea europaea var. sylvestris]|uniref:probable disease resistance protein At5g66900 n=1 Tax=Olea europaea var. sylvestris TaxID=158386 RepID=UPI000C1CF4C5|nr:probable disease resistance protein At5g66900 [Olea europaea var. sylvestris]